MRSAGMAFIAAMVIYAGLFGASVYWHASRPKPALLQDVSRTFAAQIHRIVPGSETAALQEALREAAADNLKVSISGKRHSQGGHIFYEDAVVLDMLSYNRILFVDPLQKLVRVQSGATWADVQHAVHPYGLAVRVMQSSNIFTVGGSLSVNAHGRDLRYGPIIETVQSLRLLQADGSIVELSRSKQPELFRAVIGGYGLFGVILDADLMLTENEVYRTETVMVTPEEYPDFFRNRVLGDEDAILTIARLSIAPDSFMREMYSTVYKRTGETADGPLNELTRETNIERNKFLFGLSRKFDWGKEMSWRIQKTWMTGSTTLVRNHAMRPDIEFLSYQAPDRSDVLQEYFVPVERFPSFIDRLAVIVREENANLLNATVRYVPANQEAMLSYARTESLAVVLLFNEKLSAAGEKQARQVTRRLVDAAHAEGGTYYLPYRLFPTEAQLRQSYPQWDAFVALKRKVDPDERFMNEFFAAYARER
ncbi:FAD-binding oxidoreductase [Paenibacillus sp. y28]|uniref:FAD-dependent oxidoreductase n=1 Tax=Paenibacillus sp. y28 TaxID=3129110 RepID=UPI00301842A1